MGSEMSGKKKGSGGPGVGAWFPPCSVSSSWEAGIEGTSRLLSSVLGSGSSRALFTGFVLQGTGQGVPGLPGAPACRGRRLCGSEQLEG